MVEGLDALVIRRSDHILVVVFIVVVGLLHQRLVTISFLLAATCHRFTALVEGGLVYYGFLDNDFLVMIHTVLVEN